MHASLPDGVGAAASGEVAGTGSGQGTISFVSMFACLVTEGKTPSIVVSDGAVSANTASQTTANGSENLTNLGASFGESTLDWMQFGNDNNVMPVSKINGNYIINADFPNILSFDDYGMTLSYNDGDKLCAHTGTSKGTASNSTITLSVMVDESVKHIRVYAGAWNSSATIKLYSSNGKLLASSSKFTAGSTSNCQVVTFELTVTEKTFVIIKNEPSDRADVGNVSLAGIAITGQAKQANSEIKLIEASNPNSATYDLTEEGTADWVYFGANKQKANADNISTDVLYGGLRTAGDFSSTLSYTDGEDGSASGLKTAKGFDFAKFNVTLASGDYMLKFFATAGTCTLSVCILDENGTVLYNGKTFNTLAENASAVIKLFISATVEETLTVVFYKDDSSSGVAGLSAVALEKDAVVEILTVTASASVTDTQSVYLDSCSSYDTLYWEHYSNAGTNVMLNATDLITSNNAESGNDFYDYVSLSWTNGKDNNVWCGNTNGKCLGSEISININVNPSVKEIQVFTGAWRATNVTSLYHNGEQIAVAPSFTAGDSSARKLVTFAFSTNKETTITIKITPSDIGDAGNVSCVAIVIAGEKQTPITSLSMTSTEMTDFNTTHINLTELGTLDWAYFNTQPHSDKIEEMNGGNLIDVTTLKVQDNLKFWDYKASFFWSNGTTLIGNPTDDDVDQSVGGTNNGVNGAYVSIDVTVNEGVNSVYLWIGGYSAQYYLEAINSNGNVIFSQKMHDEVSNTSFCYQTNFTVNSSGTETLKFVVYRTSGQNCSMCAVAVA